MSNENEARSLDAHCDRSVGRIETTNQKKNLKKGR